MAGRKGTRKYVTKAWIQGLRNGKPWPKVGELIELDDLEAAEYLHQGYVREIGDADVQFAQPATAQAETAAIADPQPAGLTTASGLVAGTTAQAAAPAATDGGAPAATDGGGAPAVAEVAATGDPIAAATVDEDGEAPKPSGRPKIASKK